jgi:hypothetical protein
MQNKIPNQNEALGPFDDLALRRELAIREAIRMDEHMAANKAAVPAALDALLLMSYHRPNLKCDNHDLLPLNKIVQRNPAGYDQIACPACYLMHLERDFEQAWQPQFMVQLRVVDYHQDRDEREEHIGEMLDRIPALLPLTFHPSRAKCSDDSLLLHKWQFKRGERGVDVTCPRCFLLEAQADEDAWDPRFQLRVHFYNVPEIYIPGENG